MRLIRITITITEDNRESESKIVMVVLVLILLLSRPVNKEPQLLSKNLRSKTIFHIV